VGARQFPNGILTGVFFGRTTVTLDRIWNLVRLPNSLRICSLGVYNDNGSQMFYMSSLASIVGGRFPMLSVTEQADFHGQSNCEFGSRYQIASADSGQDLGSVLQNLRKYLLYVANSELDDQLHGKVGPSDIVQETFTQAIAAYGSFRARHEQDIRSWLRKILLNKIADARRDFLNAAKRNIRREHSLWSGTWESIHPIQDSLDSPSRLAIAEEETIAIRRMIDHLPSDYQLVIRLRNWEKLPFPEIGRRMERSDEAARKLWFRAINRLRDEWFKSSEQ